MNTARILTAAAIATVMAAPAIARDPSLGPDSVVDDSHRIDVMGKNYGSDREITREVRRAIVDDDDLSTEAKNVTVTTKDGVVTLRGPVQSERERTTITTAVREVPGVTRIENQLRVE